jgi:dual-specificity kinase
MMMTTVRLDTQWNPSSPTVYDPIYTQQTSYSTTQTPYYDSPNQSSTDRNPSALNTTAPTSLGSQVSNGQQQVSSIGPSTVGQKRKRTRAVAQDEAKEAKRRELDNDQHPFSLYNPPPNPPIKAKEVHVQIVQDVSLIAHTFVPHL